MAAIALDGDFRGYCCRTPRKAMWAASCHKSPCGISATVSGDTIPDSHRLGYTLPMSEGTQRKLAAIVSADVVGDGMDLVSVKRAYKRHAPYYDAVFGVALRKGRKHAVAKANSLPGTRVLEVGVGTGLSLGDYGSDKKIIGIDISSEMLRKAQQRVAEHAVPNIEALLEMDAERITFDDDSFDTVVALYVASVVPNPGRFLSEVRRVCKPGGDVLIVNHFAKDDGLRGYVERYLAPLSGYLGWRPDFTLESMYSGSPLMIEELRELPPFGLFSLVHICNTK